MNPPHEPSTTGLDAHVAATLAYLAGPFSGVLVLLAERASPFVRFHAWQSVIGLGGLGSIVAAFYALAFASVVVSATAFHTLLWVTAGLWVLWIVCWGTCLMKAFTRQRWRLPIAGAYAERLSERRDAT